MEHDLWNGLRLRIPEGEVPLGADSLLLADFLTLPPRARVADLGAGCGTLGNLGEVPNETQARMCDLNIRALTLMT